MSEPIRSDETEERGRSGAAAGARAAVVVGASGQDGYLLTERLLGEGFEVHAAARRTAELDALAARSSGRLRVHTVDLLEPAPLLSLVARHRPYEIYNLAGVSSVSRSFAEPLQTWRTNADFVARLLDALRASSPETRLYQASSTEMFGGAAGASVCHRETSALSPRSPYASAKAAAHLLCRAYREAYGLRVACGILSNHESRRRPEPFLTRRIADHVNALRRARTGAPALTVGAAPLAVGNLKIERDWGFAPDYVRGMQLILRQIDVRAARAGTRSAAEDDVGANYRDYVLGTGESRAAWELIDAAFRLAGFALDWRLAGDDPARWHAVFRTTGEPAVVVDQKLLRPADPLSIRVDSTLAARELGWSPRSGPEAFLSDMIDADAGRAHGD